MAFDCKMILDSVSPQGKRLVTLAATYPRCIHSEMMTHRALAKNSASSRAIPFAKMIEQINNDPFIPIKWGMEKPGMQTGEAIPERMNEYAIQKWLELRNEAIRCATQLHNIGQSRKQMTYYESEGHVSIETPVYADATDADNDIKVHKSIVNRLVEPWMWITVIISGTEWNNFFRLRCHPDAEIHMQKIAYMIRDCIEGSTPNALDYGQWHRPYVTNEDRELVLKMEATLLDELLNRISVARCARVSYLTHEGKRDITKDLELFNKLSNGSGFGHFSPYEAIATPMQDKNMSSGCFFGWEQYRKRFPLENIPGLF